ncbi:MAG TPA: DNA polymerase, partial [Acidobacteriota bacterium]|nr:DNA polymerase [Acidobacteriota bacterium]
FCECVGSYRGPVWKYDINQAYAAAMREASLPSGYAYHSSKVHRHARVYIARITATNARNKIPFYYRTFNGNHLHSVFATTEIFDTWLTSIEIEQLRSEGWQIELSECWYWDDYFSMDEYVNRLEAIRMNCEGGPNGAIGTMIKAVGNHSYGKTVEQLDNEELIISKTCPEGFSQFVPKQADGIIFSHIWAREIEREERSYHQPQIGAFITAHVRMVVRRAALLDPDSWLYADTDCVMFSSDVTSKLDVDPLRYGAWKVEARGEPYRIVAKKVYANGDASIKHAKGMNTKNLSSDDFERWLAGEVPKQQQVQRVNFVRVMQGAHMFRNLERRGTAI